jgi:DNA-binding transcriptional LysR family regulator
VVELRDIEVFLMAAQELHFGRTAERLRITPARVSQSVKKTERRVGGALFDRTTRTVRLTKLGELLQQDLSAGYRQITDGIARARAVAGGVSGRLVLGTMGSEALLIRDVIERFETRHPAAELTYREIQATAPLDAVRSGEVDAALVWLPVDDPELSVGPITHVSPVMLMLGTRHPLAGRESLCLEDLGDCVVLTGTAVPAKMEEAFHPRRTPAGRAVKRGPAVSSWHEQMSAVAAGPVVCAVAAEARQFYPRPDIVYRPLLDAPPCRWALVWRTDRHSPLVRALAEAADR